MLGLTDQSSFEEFVRFGLSDTVYIKPVILNGQHLYAAFTADGTLLTLSYERETAIELVRQNELTPTSVH